MKLITRKHAAWRRVFPVWKNWLLSELAERLLTAARTMWWWAEQPRQRWERGRSAEDSAAAWQRTRPHLHCSWLPMLSASCLMEKGNVPHRREDDRYSASRQVVARQSYREKPKVCVNKISKYRFTLFLEQKYISVIFSLWNRHCVD